MSKREKQKKLEKKLKELGKKRVSWRPTTSVVIVDASLSSLLTPESQQKLDEIKVTVAEKRESIKETKQVIDEGLKTVDTTTEKFEISNEPTTEKEATSLILSMWKVIDNAGKTISPVFREIGEAGKALKDLYPSQNRTIQTLTSTIRTKIDDIKETKLGVALGDFATAADKLITAVTIGINKKTSLGSLPQTTGSIDPVDIKKAVGNLKTAAKEVLTSMIPSRSKEVIREQSSMRTWNK